MVAGLIALTWATERQLDAAGGEWGNAIDAVTTMVLVGVTAAYVLLTYSLVQIQREAPQVRIQAQEKATRDLLTLLSNRQQRIWQLEQSFPLADENLDAAALKDVDTDELQEFAIELHTYSMQVPQQLSGWPEVVSRMLLLFTSETMRIQGAVLKEAIDALEEERPRALENILATYNAGKEKDPSDRTLFDYFVSGGLIKLVADSLEKLEVEIKEYLQGEGPSEGADLIKTKDE